MPDAQARPDIARTLRIRQQNCRKLEACQQDVINPCNPELYDLCLVQEPWLDFLGNTRAPTGWSAVYPPTHLLDGRKRTRSVIFVSPRLAGDAVTTIPIDSADITAVQVETPRGLVRILNVYNDQTHLNTVTKLRAWTDNPEANTSPPTPLQARGPGVHTMWLGDFNRHHPLWDDDHQEQMFTRQALDDADQLIQACMHVRLVQALPKGINTLETAHGNWTRPDNVFMSEELHELIVKCDVAPDIRPPVTNHLPIITELDLDLDHTKVTESYSWLYVEQDKFIDTVRVALEASGPPEAEITTAAGLEREAIRLEDAIRSVVENPDIVPRVRISPYTRRWWTPDLGHARTRHRHLKLKSWKWRLHPDDPVHADARRAETEYKELLERTKREHWNTFVTNSRSDGSVWIVHWVVTGTGTDGGRTRLPPLKTTNGDLARADEEKARALHTEFFPPPPPPLPEQDRPVPPDFPPEVEDAHMITESQVRCAINKLDCWKAVMAKDIPNAVLQWCEDLLVPYLLPLYRASLRLSHYPSIWKIYETIVLRKPEHPDYSLPKAYRPICLLKTIAKPLSIIVTEYLTHLAEKYSLLPPSHFGFRPGRSTTDSLLLLDKFVKDAWHDGNVVSVLFLDVKGAFPSVHIERLIWDMRRKGVPELLTRWITAKFTGRRTNMVFDRYRSPVPLAIDAGLDQGCPLSGILYNLYNAWVGELVNTLGPGCSLVPCFADDLALAVRGKSFRSMCIWLKRLLHRPDGVIDWSRTHNCSFEVSKWYLLDMTHKMIDDPTQPGRKTALVGLPLRLDAETTITPCNSTKYLGVKVHHKLLWSEQWNTAIAKDTEWIMTCAHVMRLKVGLGTRNSRELVLAVCLPKMTYAAEVWAPPIRRREPRNATARHPKAACRRAQWSACNASCAAD
jgi:hypothetical protein